MSEKQLRFIELWNGNATQTAEAAGYSTPSTAGKRCLDNVQICAEIQKKRASLLKPQIATREERQVFWTETMRNPEADMRDRLKTSELLGKSEGDFLERRELSGPDGGSIPASIQIEFIGGDND